MKNNSRLLGKMTALLCAAAFLLFTIPTQAQQSLQALHNHVRPVVSSGQAVPVGVLPSTQRINLAIQLPLRNESELDSFLGRLYDPKSPDYRKFLSVAQFTEQYGPTKEDYQTVVNFAKANGFTITNTPPNRLVLDINGTVAQINKAFHVVMTVYQHPTENRTFYSPDREPSLDLAVPVLHIGGLNNYATPHPNYVKPSPATTVQGNFGSGPGGSYLGGDMRAAYYGSGPLDGTGQCVGLLEFDGYNMSDVTASYDGVVNNVPINNVLLDGADGLPHSGDDGEQVLDIVQAATMAPGLNQVRVYITPGLHDVDIFNKMATENICKQLSSSWSWRPEDAAANDPILKEFMAQGQTLFVATGDYGAYTSVPPDYPYPQEDPYVTAVGATDLSTTGPGGTWVAETAWTWSSGGPSDDGFPIPSWQVGVPNPSNQASTTLRNMPDVAMEGNWDNYNCDLGVCSGGWAGTSFAAPRWAGYIALLNQQAAKIAKPPVGFINPAIYLIGQSALYSQDFHDITSGNNGCCGQTTFWNAVTGYDMVTGWGSPTGPNLIYSLLGVYPPTITSPNNTSFTVGTAGSFQVTATGVPALFTFNAVMLSPLPTGVTFSSTGLLSGTPAPGTGGTYYFTNIVGNGVAPDATQPFTLTVGQAPIITSANHTTFTVGTAGSFLVTATGFPAPTFTASGTLPVGVTLTSAGLLSGTPAAGTGGIYTLSITASNGVAPNAIQTFTLTVNQAPAITSANGTTFTTGKLGSFQVTATGFPAPTFTESGALPSGVTFNSAGLLSGTPAAGTGGIYIITIYASNGVAPVASQVFTLTVDQPPTITSANHTTFTVGKPGSFQVTATGFPAPTFTESGSLPSGVSLSPSGLLSGIPATGGIYNIIIYASNGVLPNAAQNFKLTVAKAGTTCVLHSSSDLFSNGEPIIFTAVVTSPGTITPNGGNVSFFDNRFSWVLLGQVPLVNGIASLTAVLQAPPNRQIFVAVYSGDNSFKQCTSPYIAENYQ